MGLAEIQTGFFTHDIQLRRIDELGDPLKAIGEAVNFTIFQPLLDQLLGVRGAGPGRPPWDRLLMFKILVLQLVRWLSDEKLEFELIDSASAQRFAGLSPHDAVPDSRTVWLFRDNLSKSRLPGEDGEEGTDGVSALFDLFRRELAAKGLLCREGRTVDAMIVEVPRQRNPQEDNKRIKEGEVPAAWKAKPRKLAQKDIDAGWMVKRGRNHLGYKNSIVDGNTDQFIHG
jgi:transposase, IS5 family